MPYSASEANITAFDQDVSQKGGYAYTREDKISCVVANENLTQASLDAFFFEGKKVLDVGCGDGTYTYEITQRGNVKKIIGVDPAQQAIKRAQKQYGQDKRISFKVADAYNLPFKKQSFDVIYLRGVLHHLDHPQEAIKEALRLAQHIVIVEPNGYNMVLKVLEKVSPYHKEHDEKSYWPWRLDQWCEFFGGKVVKRQWKNLVPMFCPNWMVHILDKVGGVIEKIPVLRSAICSVYVITVEKYAK